MVVALGIELGLLLRRAREIVRIKSDFPEIIEIFEFVITLFGFLVFHELDTPGRPALFRSAALATYFCSRFEGARTLDYGPAMREIPILYSFRRCPYAMRARMALLSSGEVFEHREILLRNKPALMLAASPKGTVPVLVLADGTVIDESLDIMLWALKQHDPERWLARADAELIAKFDAAFKYHLDRYKYAGRHDGDPSAHRAAGLAMLVELGARLAETGYLGGTERGFSDIALFPFVRQFAGVDAAFFAAHAPRPVQDWIATLVASDLFQRAMVKYAPWDETPYLL